jgi:uncharacterized membrane protein
VFASGRNRPLKRLFQLAGIVTLLSFYAIRELLCSLAVMSVIFVLLVVFLVLCGVLGHGIEAAFDFLRGIDND